MLASGALERHACLERVGARIAQSLAVALPPGRSERATGSVLIALTVILAAAGLALRSTPIPQLAVVAPISFFVAALASAGTAAVLLATARHTAEQRSSLVLTLDFAAGSFLTLLALGTFPTLPGNEPIVATGPQAAVAVYVLLQAVRIIGALAYATVRFGYDGPAVSRVFRTIAWIATALFVLAGLAALLGRGDLASAMLPGLDVRIAAAFSVLPLAAAAYAILRVPEMTAFDRALALSLVMLAVDSVLLSAGARFNGSYYSSRVLLMISALVVFVAAVGSLIASRATLSAVESRLATIEGESARTAGRIRALWKIASDQSTYEDERFAHILQTATASLRPGLPLLGVLSHREDDTLVIDATASTLTGPAAAALAATIVPGAAFAFADTLLGHVPELDTTRVWNDVASEPWRSTLAGRLGCRSFIGTPVTIARRTYFLSFASPYVVENEPFAEDDIAFVDVVASFIASHVTQQMHFERIQYQIEHDALTGLENRTQFRRRVRDEIASGRGFVVAFANLDGFRHVNEREGHQMGDEVLVEVAAGLTSIDAGNAIARTSGDEFGILIRGIASEDAATEALERYSVLFREPFHTGDREGTHLLSVGASIGAARYPDDGRTAEELMLRSDAALAVAKQRGGSTTLLFDEQMEAMLAAAKLRVAELSDAIAGGQLALLYQPTFDLATRRIVGAEALVRWDHPERGRISPAHFVPFAERNGLIGPLSRWVVERLVRDLTQTTRLAPGFRVYFNLAATLLENFPFISTLNDILVGTPAVVQHIGVEVTETAAMQNVERSMSTIDRLREWGLSVAIDDFGTGYSSLSYLKALTVDMIKIDRSFVSGLPSDERDAALSEMLIRITDQFGFTTLAEGIETEDQAAWLLDHGCRLGQGFLIARPGSFTDLLERIAAGSTV
jgi:diguanylate cyclase (GGDEF)-like protein